MTNGQEIQAVGASSSVPPAAPQIVVQNPPPNRLGLETAEQKQARLTESLGILKVLNADLSAFTVAAVNNLGLTIDSYIKNTKVVRSITDEDVADKLIAGAKVIDRVRRFSPRDVLHIATWMKSKGGVDVFRGVQRRKKLEKKAKGLMTVEEAVYVEALTIQMADFSAAVKRTRKKYDGEIEESRRSIQRLEMRRDKEIDNAAGEFYPGSRYEDPPEAESGEECYKRKKKQSQNKQVKVNRDP